MAPRHVRRPIFAASRLALAASMIALPVAARAQSGNASTAVPLGAGKEAQKVPDQEPQAAIGDIVVTAQFRSQNLQKTPLSITAVNAQMLEARSQTNISDVANHAPNVTLTTASGGLGGSQATSITIRGVGQGDFNLAVEPGVGMYVDDVYYGTMYGSMLDLLDLDRVEILRGPQGTLSGKNSEGGAIKLFSKQPSSTNSGYIDLTFGSFNDRKLRAGANFVVVPGKLFLRVSGLAEKQDGYVTRYDYKCRTGQPADQLDNIPSLTSGGPDGCKLGTEGGRDVLALRAALRFEPTDAIDNTLAFDDTRDRSDPAPSVLTYQGVWHGPGFSLIGAPGPNQAANFVPPPGSYYNYASYCSLIATNNQYCANPVSSVDAWGISNVLNVRLGSGVSLKSISAVRKLKQSSVKDNDASPVSRAMNGWNVDYTQFSQELRLNGSIGSLIDWTIGGYYFSANATQGGRINLDGAVDGAIPFAVNTDFLFNDPVRIRSKSAFAHVEIHPTEALTFTGGIRYTNDYKSLGFVRYFANGYVPGIIDSAIVVTNGASGVFKGERLDYRATAGYEITRDINVYAEFATGFKGGGVNPRPYYVLQVRPFQPETVKSFEVGLKTQLFDHRMRFNIAAFYNKYKDIQMTLGSCPDLVPPGAPPACYLPANVGDATIKGVEAETEFRPISGLLIDASASYLDFQYDKVGASTMVLLTDKPPFTPKYKFSTGVQYEAGLGGAGTLTPRVDFQYQSEQYSAPRNFPNGRIPGYGLTNIRLTYEDPSRTWQLSAAVTNLFDKYYALSIGDNTQPQGALNDSIVIQPGRPREFRISLKKTF